MKELAKRPLGASGIEVSAISLGCMSLSGTYGPSDDRQGLAVIEAALDSGVTLLDTSDMYGMGHNEELIARVLKTRRDGVVLATKFGNLGGKDGKFADGRPETVVRSCDASLRRLGVDVIDLYYQHRIDPDVAIEETVGAMGRLVELGKVRALGLSEAGPDTIRRAHKTHPIAAVQNEFSLLYRTEAEETRRTTQGLGISFVAYSPLGRGLLTAAIDAATTLPEGDARRRHPRFAAGNVSRNVDLVRGLEKMAQDKSHAPWASSRSPGCSLRATTSSPSPAPSVSIACARISARSMSRLPQTISQPSPR